MTTESRSPRPSGPRTLGIPRLETLWRGRSLAHWGLLAMSAAGPLALGLLALLVDPDPRGVGTHEQLGMKPCFPMEAWNLPCPGCGVTTSVALFAEGQPWRSLANQPLGFALALAALAALPLGLYRHVRGRDLYADLCLLPWRVLGLSALVFAGVAWLYKIWLVRLG